MKKTKPTPKSARKPKSIATSIYFLLDRSGSMGSCITETISGFNAYVTEMEKKCKGQPVRFCLTQFDSQGIDDVFGIVKLADVPKLTRETYQPRGGTPLYDAMGKTIHKAAGNKDGNVLFVTLTDGEENQSSEYSLQALQSLIKDKESKGWTFAHIGMGIGGWSGLQNIAQGTQSASNILRTKTGGKGAQKAYAAMAGSTSAYMARAAKLSISGQAIGCSVDFFAGNKDDEQDNE